jgi:hypothetical protein
LLPHNYENKFGLNKPLEVQKKSFLLVIDSDPERRKRKFVFSCKKVAKEKYKFGENAQKTIHDSREH